MKKYVIKISASGALCLTQISCGANQAPKENIAEIEMSAQNQAALEQCSTSEEDKSVEEFLDSLDQQGRIKCNKFFSEERDLQQKNVVPGNRN
jgi:hypothetical protein